MKRIDIMSRSGFLKHGSKMILKFDLSGLKNADEVGKVADFFSSIALKMPKKSVVGLVDLTGLHVHLSTLNEMIRLTYECNPHFKATAVLALGAATKNLANSVITYYGNINMKVFENQLEAMDWLAGQ